MFSIDLNGKKVKIKPLEIKYCVWWNHSMRLILTDKTPALGDDYGAGSFHDRDVFYERNLEDINKLIHYAEEDYLFWKDNTVYISPRLTDEVKECHLTEGGKYAVIRVFYIVLQRIYKVGLTKHF